MPSPHHDQLQDFTAGDHFLYLVWLQGCSCCAIELQDVVSNVHLTRESQAMWHDILTGSFTGSNQEGMKESYRAKTCLSSRSLKVPSISNIKVKILSSIKIDDQIYYFCEWF